MIDEADTFLRQSDELRGIINSGHTHDTAFVIRTVGEDHEPRRFATWSPKAIACIGDAPDTIEDRAIVIHMRRKLPSETVTRLRYKDRYRELGSQCLRWLADHIDALRAAEPDLPGELNDRAADNWTPLLAIADAAAGKWPKRARDVAKALSGGEQTEDTSARVQLLADICAVFEARKLDCIRSVDLVDALVDMEDRAWPEWRKGKPLTATQLARLLRPFGISPGTRRGGDDTFKGYVRDKFNDAFRRYLPARAVTRSQPAPGSHLSKDQSGNTAPNVTASNSPKSAPHKGCNRVTAQQDGNSAEASMMPAFAMLANPPGDAPWHEQYPPNDTTIDGGPWSMRI